jgi:hypothetical protein
VAFGQKWADDSARNGPGAGRQEAFVKRATRCVLQGGALVIGLGACGAGSNEATTDDAGSVGGSGGSVGGAGGFATGGAGGAAGGTGGTGGAGGSPEAGFPTGPDAAPDVGPGGGLSRDAGPEVPDQGGPADAAPTPGDAGLAPDPDGGLPGRFARWRIVLTWETPGDDVSADADGTDVDLHLLHPDGELWGGAGPLDAYYANPVPDWGRVGDPTDNPVLVLDDVDGQGPEVLDFDVLTDTADLARPFLVGVHLYRAESLRDGRDFGPSTARVVVFGPEGLPVWDSDAALGGPIDLAASGAFAVPLAIAWADDAPAFIPLGHGFAEPVPPGLVGVGATCDDVGAYVCGDAAVCLPDDLRPVGVCAAAPCLFVGDGICDEPGGTGRCAAGSDALDCAGEPACGAEGCVFSVAAPWAPAARMSALSMPISAQCAVAAGCGLLGESGGFAISGLLPVLDPELNPRNPEACDDADIGSGFRPDEGGRISDPRLVHFEGIDDGEALGATGPITLGFLTGEAGPDAGRWVPTAESFEADGRTPRARIAGATLDPAGRLDTPPSDFELTFEVGGVRLRFPLRAAHVRGDVRPGAGGEGAAVSNGVIGGYLTTAGLVTFAVALQQACEGPVPPPPCNAINAILPPGSCTPDDCQAGVALFEAFLGGFDTYVDAAGTPEACAPARGDCNALPVCARFEAIPTVLDGPAR